ncbi:DUF692 domain-containing protein [Chitinibacter sp. SCUT-21]|uniref:DUF692 domain-containing protein n=1 Tax=Chitinibacter sp. SCUT-21 TaxID=2970891 RepID=UPI0035A619F3
MKTALPTACGLGLRAPHIETVLAERPAVAWWEVHSENYFAVSGGATPSRELTGGAAITALTQLRQDYPISLHGVGMGLGRLDPLDPAHLAQLKQLVARIEPAAVSEHLAWNHFAQRHFNDLLPVPRVEGVIEHLATRIDQVQTALQRPILIENVSAYVGFADEMLSEAQLMVELARRTGCGLLVDLNNFHVNTLNLGLDAAAELAQIPGQYVEEIHVAGFEWFDGTAVDTHGAPISAEVFALLQQAQRQWGAKPVLLERDTNLSSFADLYHEYRSLDQYMNTLQGNTSKVYA